MAVLSPHLDAEPAKSADAAVRPRSATAVVTARSRVDLDCALRESDDVQNALFEARMAEEPQDVRVRVQTPAGTVTRQAAQLKKELTDAILTGNAVNVGGEDWQVKKRKGGIDALQEMLEAAHRTGKPLKNINIPDKVLDGADLEQLQRIDRLIDEYWDRGVFADERVPDGILQRVRKSIGRKQTRTGAVPTEPKTIYTPARSPQPAARTDIPPQSASRVVPLARPHLTHAEMDLMREKGPVQKAIGGLAKAASTVGGWLGRRLGRTAKAA
jgi:hypothetical protein